MSSVEVPGPGDVMRADELHRARPSHRDAVDRAGAEARRALERDGGGIAGRRCGLSRGGIGSGLSGRWARGAGGDRSREKESGKDRWPRHREVARTRTSRLPHTVGDGQRQLVARRGHLGLAATREGEHLAGDGITHHHHRGLGDIPPEPEAPSGPAAHLHAGGAGVRHGGGCRGAGPIQMQRCHSLGPLRAERHHEGEVLRAVAVVSDLERGEVETRRAGRRRRRGLRGGMDRGGAADWAAR